MGDPNDWALDAANDEAFERSGQEFFDQNWDTLLPTLSRELIIRSASGQRATHRGAARAALRRADEAIGRFDAAGAFFHIRRCVEGYSGQIFTRPIFEYLNDAMGAAIPLFSKPLHKIFRDAFVVDLKRLSIKIIANDEDGASQLLSALDSFYKAQPFRNDVFHSLFEPALEVVKGLRADAEAILDQMDAIVPTKKVRVLICTLDKLNDFHWHAEACYEWRDEPEVDEAFITNGFPDS